MYLVDHMINGTLDKSLSVVLLSSKLIGLTKPNNGVRPIAISEIFYRMASKYLLNFVDSSFLTNEGQYGVKVERGSEKIIHELRLKRVAKCFHKVICLDISNAFNTLSRNHLYKLLCDQSPNLVNFFKWPYGKQSNLIFYDQVIPSNTGVKQGDPISPFLYALGTIHVLSFLNNYPGVEVKSYLDDTYILCQKEVSIELLLNELELIFKQIGLKLNLTKTEVFSVEDDFMCLGSPIGSTEFESSFIIQEVQNELIPSLFLLKSLPLQNQFLIFRHCINSILMYWARTVPYESTSMGFHLWVSEFVAYFNLMGLEESNNFDLIYSFILWVD
ncbi:hypothetical protein P9112_007608 [Eukaryota sp. TZLM1-RC]